MDMENSSISLDSALFELLGGATAAISTTPVGLNETSWSSSVTTSLVSLGAQVKASSLSVSSTSHQPLREGKSNANASGGDRSRVNELSKGVPFVPPSPSSSFSSDLSLLPSQLSKPLPRLAPEEIAKLAPLASVSLHSKKRPRHSSSTGGAKFKSPSKQHAKTTSSPPASPFARFGPFLTSSSPLARDAAMGRLVIGISPQGGVRTVTSVPPLPSSSSAVLSSSLSSSSSSSSSSSDPSTSTVSLLPVLSTSGTTSGLHALPHRDRTLSQASSRSQQQKHQSSIVLETLASAMPLISASSEAVVLLEQLEQQQLLLSRVDEEKKPKRRHRKRALSATSESKEALVSAQIDEVVASDDRGNEEAGLNTVIERNGRKKDEDEVEENVEDLVAMGLAFLEEQEKEEQEEEEEEQEEEEEMVEETYELQDDEVADVLQEEEYMVVQLDEDNNEEEEVARMARKAARKEQRRQERRELKRHLREQAAMEAEEEEEEANGQNEEIGDAERVEKTVEGDVTELESAPPTAKHSSSTLSDKPGRKERRRLKRLAKEAAAAAGAS